MSEVIRRLQARMRGRKYRLTSHAEREREKRGRLMERCYFCKGTVKKRAIRHVHQWGERVFIFGNVTAEVCTQCGETYFGPEALAQVDKIVAAPPEPDEVVQVPVYSL